ncbi:tRNA dihydrouridine synthase [Conglomerata obtusa]
MDFFNNLPKPTFILAPMVNNSGLAYRTLAKRYGAHLTYTQMVHAKMFNKSKCNVHDNQWYSTNQLDSPLVVQICGNDPMEMLNAALKIQNVCNAIDINFGCPQNIAKAGNYGAFLQNDWTLTAQIIKTLSTNLSIPVFCKIRIFEDVNKSIEYAKMIEDSGCSLLAVHGRTIKQKGIYTGLADLTQIRAIKKALKIPVIANGNVMENKDLQKVLHETKCDGIMVAETHLYNPLIFCNVKKDCFVILQEYFDLCDIFPTKMVEIKSHVFKILHNVLNIHKEYRELLQEANSFEALKRYVSDLSQNFDKNSSYTIMQGLKRLMQENE